MEEIAFSHGYTVLFGSTDEQKKKLDRLVFATDSLTITAIYTIRPPADR